MKGEAYTGAQPNQKRLLSPETAYEMTLMLEKVVTRGTGTQARMDRPVAGKTGTTQLPDTPEFRDANGRVIEGTETRGSSAIHRD